MIRLMQSNEGITLLDAGDSLEVNQFAFMGLSDMLVQFGQQLSGAADVPLTRMFGQSPAGMSSTGESDLRNYYDGLASQQEMRLRGPVQTLYELVHRSLYGLPLPKAFGFKFNPLWQLTEEAKSSITTSVTSSVVQALEAQVIDVLTAAKELRQLSRTTGTFSNITDEYLKDLEANPPEAQMGEDPNAPPGPDQGTGEEAGGAEGAEGAESGSEIPLGTSTRDSFPVHDFHGLRIVVETPKGTRRTGYGWSVQMPSDYGYVSGTSSAEGPREQMDAFVGDDLTAPRVWVVEQRNLGTNNFDEHKLMCGFSSKDEAVSTYCAAFSDGRGRDRVMKVREMPSVDLAEWLQHWRYGTSPRLRAVK
jgi:hypothetical protein